MSKKKLDDKTIQNMQDEQNDTQRAPWMPPEGYDPERDADIRYELEHGKKRRLKKRTTAASLAGYGAVLGLHKFYLGKPLMGILYIFLSLISCCVISVILGIFESSALSVMGDVEFDEKYNKDKLM